MAQVVEFEKREIVSSEELLTQHLSDIRLEIESLKVMAWKKDDKEMLSYMKKIDDALDGITNVKLDIFL